MSSPYDINIGSIKPISTFIQLYPGHQIKSVIRQFQDSFPHYRFIRGDGNCFYRAFAYLLLTNSNKKSFKQLFPNTQLHCERMPMKIRTNAEYGKMVNELVVKEVDFILEEKSKSRREKAIQRLFNNRKMHFDILIIAYLRSLNYQNISNHKHKYKEFTDRDLKEELNRIQMFGQQSQGIELASLSDIFRVGMTVICVDNSHLQPVYYQKYPNDGFYFFYRPGHYDLIYPMQAKENKSNTRVVYSDSNNDMHPLIQLLIVLLIFMVCGYVGIHYRHR